MAKATARGRKPPPDDDEAIDPDFTKFGVPIDSAGVEQVQAQVGELPDGAKVNVYRMRTGVRPPFAFLEQMAGAHFDLSDIKARYGGGEFLIRAWQKGVSGFLVNERFSIEGEPIIAVTRAPAPVAIQSSVPGAPPIYMMPGQQGGADAITALATMFTQAIDRLGAMIVQQRPQNGMREALETLTIAKAIVAPAQSSNDVLGMLSQVMGIMREAQPLAGEGGKADGWSIMQTAVEKVLPEIVRRLPANPAPAMLANPHAGPTPAPFLPPSPTPMSAPTPGSMAEAAAAAIPAGPASVLATAPFYPHVIQGGAMSFNPVVMATFGVYAPMLTQAAMIGADPGDYAANIVDMIDATEGGEAAVREFLARSDWFDALARVSPAVTPYRAWFVSLGAEIFSLLNEPAAEEGASEPEATERFGDTGH